MFKGFQKPKRLVICRNAYRAVWHVYAQPFQRGFSTTIGNGRGALLSSIEGAAIAAVRIEGVEHEFSVRAWSDHRH